jgi:riboflavin synthase
MGATERTALFTGLIEEIGTVRRVGRDAAVTTLAVAAPEILMDLAVGDSVAVDGACLTVTLIEDGLFEVQLSEETLARTTLGEARPGLRVNLERPCRLVDRLGGHIVTGHVDGIGAIVEIQPTGGAWRFRFSYPEPLQTLLVEKGSIAVDGISLTIADLSEASFAVAVIPHTYHHTTLGQKDVGSRVNLEGDLIGKYVMRYLRGLVGAGAGTGRRGAPWPAALGPERV